VCGITHVTVDALCSSRRLLCISNSDWATENEAGRSVSVNGNEEPAGAICHQYSSVVTAVIPYWRTIKFQYTLLEDYWECVRPARLSVLTWVPSSVPPGNFIQDTFPAGSTQDKTDWCSEAVNKLSILFLQKRWRRHIMLVMQCNVIVMT